MRSTTITAQFTCFAGETIAHCDSLVEVIGFAAEAAQQGYVTTVRYANGTVEVLSLDQQPQAEVKAKPAAEPTSEPSAKRCRCAGTECVHTIQRRAAERNAKRSQEAKPTIAKREITLDLSSGYVVMAQRELRSRIKALTGVVIPASERVTIGDLLLITLEHNKACRESGSGTLLWFRFKVTGSKTCLTKGQIRNLRDLGF